MYMYMCTYACICIYIYIYMYTHVLHRVLVDVVPGALERHIYIYIYIERERYIDKEIQRYIDT